MAMRGILDLARPLIRELSESGMGADRIYRQVRSEFGRGITRDAIRSEAYLHRTDQYKDRYYGVRREFGFPASAFRHRPAGTTQKNTFLWEFQITAVDRYGKPQTRYATYTDNLNHTEEELLTIASDTFAIAYELSEPAINIIAAWRK